MEWPTGPPGTGSGPTPSDRRCPATRARADKTGGEKAGSCPRRREKTGRDQDNRQILRRAKGRHVDGDRREAESPGGPAGQGEQARHQKIPESGPEARLQGNGESASHNGRVSGRKA